MHLGYNDSDERMARHGAESASCFTNPTSCSPLVKSRTSRKSQESGSSTGNTNQGFDNYDLVATNELSARTLSNSDESLDELRTRLLQLQGQVVYLQNENRRLSILSNGGYSSPTLDEESDNDDTPDISFERKLDKLNESDRSRFDLCRWIRGPGGTTTQEPKLRALHRRHASTPSGRPAKPPLRLCRPAAVSELLGKHSGYTQSIGEFMSRYTTMTPFKPYTLEGAHDMPAMPGVALINDLATQHLPPLAGEEYAGHVSRISYLIRALHSIELADPEFLANPRVNMFVDLVLDLEQSLTLPRIDFLRRHSETIQAMNIHARQQRLRTKTDTEYVIGDAETLCWGLQPDALEMALVSARTEKTLADPRHIGHMARAIPRHPDFRNSDKRDAKTDATTNESSSNRVAPSELILGDRLKPSRAFYLESPSATDSKLVDVTVSEIESSSANVAANRSFSMDAQSPDNSALRQYQVMSPDSAIAAGFDPKLHPVVGPRSMDVAPTLQISNNRSMPLLLYAQASTRYSQRLRHQAPPRIQTLGACSEYQTKNG
ncbi:hypothetical protein IWW39_006023 [Coemansia spiralis]|uniref:Uncharacterized protein n=1 Tax=Coemansia spiralis TaxID=417178 RepID=A0A9W8L182_9FUNG|nr:hypothetical protein IWW39_006023 [Coemansia spiralis]